VLPFSWSISEIQRIGTGSRYLSNCSSHGILESLKLDFVNLIENSVSVNTWNVYANAEKSFLSVRLFIFSLKPIAAI
jgi:hypothetical protein